MSHSTIGRNSYALLVRTVLFLILFASAIGLCLNWLFAKELFVVGDFWIYGNKGKIFILLFILLPFIIREKMGLMPRIRWQNSQLLYGGGLVLSLLGFFISSTQIYNSLPEIPTLYYLASHAFLIFIPIFLLFFIFGHNFIAAFTSTFIKELSVMLVIGIILSFGVAEIWSLWPILSEYVLKSVATVFAYSFPTKVIPPDILVVKSFSVRVGEECSGLESLFMFSSLYALIGYFDRNMLRKIWFLFAYFPLAIGLYLINILRVYLIVLVGVLWSPDLAVKLFHTYLGMVFFIAYFLLFIRYIYPRLKISVDKKK